MKVTFIIGNGFDLRLGMRTSYKDMYNQYLQTDSSCLAVKEFKEHLASDKENEYETWADFEIAMGEYASHFDNENDFITCIRDFKAFVIHYLEDEQSKYFSYLREKGMYNLYNAIMTESLESFYKGQTRNVVNEINYLGGSVSIIENCDFITFNYTTVLDFLANQCSRFKDSPLVNRIVHIHGKIGEDIVLGINDITQFNKLKFPVTRRVKRAFIKPEFNNQYDERRVIDAINKIKQSDVICIYGMSLGDSDEMWRNQIYNWLLADKNHHLVYYVYDTKTFDSWNRDAIMDEEEIRKDALLDKLCKLKEERDSLFSQIHIPVGFDIFDFDERIAKAPKPPKPMGNLKAM